MRCDNGRALHRCAHASVWLPPPRRDAGAERVRVKQVSCGESHTLLLSEGGMVYSFGLGMAAVVRPCSGGLVPRVVLACSSAHSSAIFEFNMRCTTDDICCFAPTHTHTHSHTHTHTCTHTLAPGQHTGRNGRLGHGSEVSLAHPVSLSVLSPRGRARLVRCGYYHSMVLLQSGFLWVRSHRHRHRHHHRHRHRLRGG
jgi:hypothetical protein